MKGLNKCNLCSKVTTDCIKVCTPSGQIGYLCDACVTYLKKKYNNRDCCKNCIYYERDAEYTCSNGMGYMDHSDICTKFKKKVII